MEIIRPVSLSARRCMETTLWSTLAKYDCTPVGMDSLCVARSANAPWQIQLSQEFSWSKANLY